MNILFFVFMYSFVKNRKTAYIIAAVLTIFSLVSPFILPFRQGIDLTGGIQAEYSITEGSVEKTLQKTKITILADAKKSLTPEQQNIITDTLAYSIAGTKTIVIEAGVDESVLKNMPIEQRKTEIKSATSAFLGYIANAYKNDTTIKAYQGQDRSLDASVGQYIKNSGYLTLTLAVIAISLYIMYAFSGSIPGHSSWPFAVVTGASMIHDVIVAFGLYVLVSALFPQFKIDTFFLTAMLTVLGYSINDTIVILDRVRTTMKEQKNIALPTVIDSAIHSTMRRSIFTSLTIVIVLVAMFIWAPHSISGFTLAMIFGTVVGTYSSIFLAAPALVDIYAAEKNKK